ncbi:MAG: transposase [Pseudomonadota bacterium]
MPDALGLDVSQDQLDACLVGNGVHRRFIKDAAGLRALCRWAPEQDGAIVVFEASGAHHRGLERALAHRGLTFAKVNPRPARRFAEAIGQVAKTDRVEAAGFARMGRALQLEPTAGGPEPLSERQDLPVYRRGLAIVWRRRPGSRPRG